MCRTVWLIALALRARHAALSGLDSLLGQSQCCMASVFTCHCTPAGKLRLYVSNNDRQVRVFDMPSMRQVDTICCPAPVNYSSLSPDGDLLACVGDSEETHLYRAGPSGDPARLCIAQLLLGPG